MARFKARQRAIKCFYTRVTLGFNNLFTGVHLGNWRITPPPGIKIFKYCFMVKQGRPRPVDHGPNIREPNPTPCRSLKPIRIPPSSRSSYLVLPIWSKSLHAFLAIWSKSLHEQGQSTAGPRPASRQRGIAGPACGIRPYSAVFRDFSGFGGHAVVGNGVMVHVYRK